MSFEQSTATIPSNVKKLEGAVEKIDVPVSTEGLPWSSIESNSVEALSFAGGVDEIPNAEGGVDQVRRSGSVTLSTNELYGKNVYIRIPGAVISDVQGEPDRIFSVAGDGRGGALMTEVQRNENGNWASDPDTTRVSGRGEAITAGRAAKNSLQLAGEGISSKHFSVTGGVENGELCISSDALNGLEVIVAPAVELQQAPVETPQEPTPPEPAPPSAPIVIQQGGRSGMGIISGVDFKGDPRRVPGHPSNPTNNIRQAAVEAAQRLEAVPSILESAPQAPVVTQVVETPKVEQVQKPDPVAEAIGLYPQGVLVERSGGAIMRMRIVPDRVRTGFKRGTTERVTEPVPEGYVLAVAENGDTRFVALDGLEGNQATLQTKAEAIKAAESNVNAAQVETGKPQEAQKSNQEVALDLAQSERMKLTQDEQVAVWKYVSDLKWSLGLDPSNYRAADQARAQAMDKRRLIKTDEGRRVADLFDRAMRVKD